MHYMSMKLVSVNIEGGTLKYCPCFLVQEQADVVCLMEVAEQDLLLLLPDYMYRVWHPNFYDLDGNKNGIAIATKSLFRIQNIFGDGRREE